MQITGIVLAGGRGTRMGGIDKGLADFLGKPMVVHVIERLQPQVNEIFINANREIERYRAFGLPVIHDEIDGFAGPLAGLHAGIKAASSPYVLTSPCDSPILPLDLASRMMKAIIASKASIAIAKTGSQLHPVYSLTPVSALSSLEKYLNGGGRKMEAWQKSMPCVEVAFDDSPLAFSNINTIGELEELERETLAQAPGT